MTHIMGAAEDTVSTPVLRVMRRGGVRKVYRCVYVG